jgi:ubiquitin-conjugating enzyme E2 G1
MQDLINNDDIGASVGLENEDDLFLWNVIFEGPADTLYEVSRLLISKGGFFKAILKFPKDYPNNPPEMRFMTQMWHPNIF